MSLSALLDEHFGSNSEYHHTTNVDLEQDPMTGPDHTYLYVSCLFLGLVLIGILTIFLGPVFFPPTFRWSIPECTPNSQECKWGTCVNTQSGKSVADEFCSTETIPFCGQCNLGTELKEGTNQDSLGLGGYISSPSGLISLNFWLTGPEGKDPSVTLYNDRTKQQTHVFRLDSKYLPPNLDYSSLRLSLSRPIASKTHEYKVSGSAPVEWIVTGNDTSGYPIFRKSLISTSADVDGGLKLHDTGQLVIDNSGNLELNTVDIIQSYTFRDSDCQPVLLDELISANAETYKTLWDCLDAHVLNSAQPLEPIPIVYDSSTAGVDSFAQYTYVTTFHDEEYDTTLTPGAQYLCPGSLFIKTVNTRQFDTDMGSGQTAALDSFELICDDNSYAYKNPFATTPASDGTQSFTTTTGFTAVSGGFNPDVTESWEGYGGALLTNAKTLHDFLVHETTPADTPGIQVAACPENTTLRGIRMLHAGTDDINAFNQNIVANIRGFDLVCK